LVGQGVLSLSWQRTNSRPAKLAAHGGLTPSERYQQQSIIVGEASKKLEFGIAGF
jgi:proline racemase